MPSAPGLASMMKEGTTHFKGMEEAVFRNIEACKELAKSLKSCYGPNGRNKMVINHLEKLFVTNDAATIVKEIEVQHPAAKIAVMASHQQEEECGDGTNLVILIAGALLEQAEELLRMGLSVAEVADGYEKACNKALEVLPSLSCGKMEDFRSEQEAMKAICSSVASKQYGNEFTLGRLIAQACITVMPEERIRFNVDAVRVCKILGSSLSQSQVVSGMVFKRLVESDIITATDAKVAVFSCALDVLQTETKGTVLLQNADELMSFSKGEENVIEKQIKAIADAGVRVIVTGGKIGDLALHFCNRYNLMTVRLMSKFDLRRVAKMVGATPLQRLNVPTPEELGHCSRIYQDEIGDNQVIIFKQDSKDSNVATIVLRGATENAMDDMERAVDDGVNCFKTLTKDNRLLAGSGALEMELARHLIEFGQKQPGLDQYAIKKFAEALEEVPKTLADNCGVKSMELMAAMHTAHQKGERYAGFDIDAGNAVTKDAAAAGIFDLYLTKHWALKFATNAACTILRVDQIIMSKPAGQGPKPRDNKGWDNED